MMEVSQCIEHKNCRNSWNRSNGSTATAKRELKAKKQNKVNTPMRVKKCSQNRVANNAKMDSPTPWKINLKVRYPWRDRLIRT